MLELRSISKSYGSQLAVNQISLTIQEGEFFSLLGPSGCGKTTLLRMLAGIEIASSGEIWMNGKRIDKLPANQRQFNMVFQKYALFPHLSVRENIAFGLKMKKVGAREISQRVDESLALVQMESYAERSPQTLSGGQQQRVALARALVNRPKVLLLDEPLSALDLKLRQQMQLELVALQKRLKHTFIFVTHDQEEAMTLSDRIAVMNGGVLEQVGSGREIYENPNSAFVAKFIGTMNSIEVVVDSLENHVVHVKTNTGIRFSVPLVRDDIWSRGQDATLMIRPEKARIVHIGDGLSGELTRIIYQGPSTQYLVAINSQLTISVQQPSFEALRSDFKVGERVGVEFPEDSIHLMPRPSA